MKQLFTLIMLAGFCTTLFSKTNLTEYEKATYYFENGGEVYFTFALENRAQINQLTNVLSIDKVEHETVHAYANKQEFDEFLSLGLFYEVLTHPGDLLQNPAMAHTPEELSLEWDRYPTFDAYVDMMYQFEEDYPELCKIIQYGESVNGRELLYAKISDSVNVKEPEPRHMYASTMHGDETCMFVNSLRLIDYLLSNYTSDEYVKKLVDNVEIWICPDENPDGTYQNDNSTVQGARRYNANNVDINRHFPTSGAELDRSVQKEPECQAVMDLIDTCQFVLSANCHGGAELLNYPYDFGNVRHADDAWMEYVYRKFANTVHDVDPSYLTGGNDGIIRGWTWYEIQGSRMDYNTWFGRIREVTFEASTSKLLEESKLNDYWDCYYEACLEYIEQNLFGINGTVKCGVGDTGISVKVYIASHDNEQSYVYSKLPHGDFWRPILAGTYDVEFSRDGYQSYVEEGVQVKNDEATVLNLRLWADGTGIDTEQGIQKAAIAITPSNGRYVKFTLTNQSGSSKVGIFDISGRLIKMIPVGSYSGNSTVVWDGVDAMGSQVGNGCYLVKTVGSGSKTLTKSFILSR